MDNCNRKMLEQPIAELNLSNDCKTYLIGKGICRLAEVIEIGWQGMRDMQPFDNRMFNEVIKFLDDAGLLSLMDRQYS